jgi:hypothetical protein
MVQPLHGDARPRRHHRIHRRVGRARWRVWTEAGLAMVNVTLSLRPFDSIEDATRVTDDINEAGEVSYTDASGAIATVYVASATVEEGV